jgi:hypothetical protein
MKPLHATISVVMVYLWIYLYTLVTITTQPTAMDAVLDARLKEDSSAKVVLTLIMIFVQKFVETVIICL